MFPLKKILISAGELSGDRLAGEILQELPKCLAWGLGGPSMLAAGVSCIKTIDSLSTIGFDEAISKYKAYKRLMLNITAMAVENGTKEAILVDYSGFHLRLAGYLKKSGIRCFLVVSPQIWAWRYGRIKKIRAHIETVLCLYKFETEIYERENVSSFFMGHPIVDRVATPRERSETVLFLPGSRKQELLFSIPLYIEVANILKPKYPDLSFTLSITNTNYLAEVFPTEIPAFIQVSQEPAPSLLASSKAALACSGTVTMECALAQTPYAIVYKVSWLSYILAKTIGKVKYLGMASILAKRQIAQEFINHRLRPKLIAKEMEKLLYNDDYRSELQQEYKSVRPQLGDPGAAQRAGSFIKKAIFS
jgi:lipid-A-disaccharide synthase